MFCRYVFGNISGGFRGISRFLGGISRDFAEIPEFRGSATARNIRSPEYRKNGNWPVVLSVNVALPLKIGLILAI